MKHVRHEGLTVRHTPTVTQHMQEVSWAPWEYVKDWHFKQLAFLNSIIIAHMQIKYLKCLKLRETGVDNTELPLPKPGSKMHSVTT